MSKKALLIVDVQNDFCPSGALAVPDGDSVVGPINKMAEHAKANGWRILASRDWHPEKTVHFDKWPIHCVKNTPGAEFHPLLKLPVETSVISKGMGDKDDGYSLFEGLKIRENDWPLSPDALICNCDIVFVCGLAIEYCVKATTLDAIKKGLKTYLLLDACRAVNVQPGDKALALNEMANAGVKFINTDEVIAERL